eukprot:gene31523-40938_t
MKLQLERLQLKWKTNIEASNILLRINIVGVRELIAREVINTNDGNLCISYAERFETDIPKTSYDGKQQIAVELIASNNKVIATGAAILRDLLPSLNEDNTFEIKLSGGSIVHGSGIIHDIDALKASESRGSPSSSFSAGGDNSELVRQLNDYKSTIKQLKSALEESYSTNNESKISSSTYQQSISTSADQPKYTERRKSLSPERSRDNDREKIEELERTVRSLQSTVQTMSEEKQQVHKAVSETNSAAAEFLYQLELQNLELSNQIDQEVACKQQMESDLQLCRSNLKRSLEQLKKQVDINERL